MKVYFVLNALVVCVFCKPASVSVIPPEVSGATISSQYHAQDALGHYSYGYTNGLSAKTESKFPDGVTRGFYSYIDADGKLQSIEYTADDINGFRVSATNVPTIPVIHSVGQNRADDSVEINNGDISRYGQSETRHGQSGTRQGQLETRQGQSETRQGQSETRHGQSETGHDSSEIRHNESETRYDSSEIRQGQSETRHDSSEIRHESSGIRHDSSGIRHDSSGIRHDSSGIRQDSSAVRYGQSETRHDQLKTRPSEKHQTAEVRATIFPLGHAYSIHTGPVIHAPFVGAYSVPVVAPFVPSMFYQYSVPSEGVFERRDERNFGSGDNSTTVEMDKTKEVKTVEQGQQDDKERA